MKLRKDNLHAHELLGMEVIVLDNKGEEIMKGIIFDESKETIKIKNDSKKRIFIKRSHDFVFEINNERIKIKGINLIGRPEERIRKI
jgi:ribonuclease P protein subunit POP4